MQCASVYISILDAKVSFHCKHFQYLPWFKKYRSNRAIYKTIMVMLLFSDSIQVITNGYLSFGTSYIDFIPQLFPEGRQFLVAPFWADIDVSRGVGDIRYEVHTTSSSGSFLTDVSDFISNVTGSQFTGHWMLLVEWNDVPHFGTSLDLVRTGLIHIYLQCLLFSLYIVCTDVKFCHVYLTGKFFFQHVLS